MGDSSNWTSLSTSTKKETVISMSALEGGERRGKREIWFPTEKTTEVMGRPY